MHLFQSREVQIPEVNTDKNHSLACHGMASAADQIHDAARDIFTSLPRYPITLRPTHRARTADDAK